MMMIMNSRSGDKSSTTMELNTYYYSRKPQPAEDASEEGSRRLESTRRARSGSFHIIITTREQVAKIKRADLATAKDGEYKAYCTVVVVLLQ